MNLSRSRILAFVATLGIAAILPAHAETAASAPSAAPTPVELDKQQLIAEVAEMEAELERVLRTRGEGGVHRLSLRRKLADKKAMAEFHLKLIERLERIEQRVASMEARPRAN
jgi:hypothetical protein